MIEKAREAETRTLKEHGVYEKVPVEECWRVAGKARAGVKWVDANEGDKEKPEYRCRLAAKEINKGKRDDMFAATPPPEAKKVLFSLFASMPERCLDFIDAVRAYFHATARRDVYVGITRRSCSVNSRRRCTARGMLPRAWSWSTLR